MNRLHRIALPVAAAAAVAALFAALGDGRSEAPTTRATAETPPAEAPSARAAITPTRVAAHEVMRSTYDLRYDRLVTLGNGQAALELSGTWTVVPLGPDRVQVRLDVEGHDAAEPAPPGLALAFQLGFSDGRLTGIGHLPDVSPAARNLLAEVATALAPTAGEGPEWTAEETDLNGQYIAHYRRIADGSERVRAEYPAVSGITASGQTRFRFDDAGLLAARVDETTERTFDGVDMPASASVQARLQRRQVEAVARPRVRLLPLGPIAPTVDPAGLRAADRNRIGDADLSTVQGWLDRLAAGAEDDYRLRHGVLAKLRTFARLEPGALGGYVEMLRQAPPKQARMMAAALGDAATPQATAALTGMLADEALRPEVRQAAHFALNTTQAPSPESARALLAEIDDPEHGKTALLAAANQARTLEGADATVTDDIVLTLIARYAEAPDIATRSTLLAALGNTGDVRILPTLAEALGHGDVTLAKQATLALRHVPSAQADGMLEAVLLQHRFEAVRIEAVRAIAIRDRGLWRPRLEAWLPGFAAQVHLTATVKKLLVRWDGLPAALASAE